ncbi:hypothetical protein [Halospina sp. K52047b]|nr:hypothetical protein [Halospina sp. K52047b]
MKPEQQQFQSVAPDKAHALIHIIKQSRRLPEGMEFSAQVAEQQGEGT